MSDQPRKRYPNSGILSRNEEATQENGFAPYKGQADLDCPHCQRQIQFWINSWVKDGSRGKFFSLNFKPKGGVSKPQPPDPHARSNPKPNPNQPELGERF